MTTLKILRPRVSIDGLYLSRKEGNLEDCGDVSMQRLKDNIMKRKKKLTPTVNNSIG